MHVNIAYRSRVSFCYVVARINNKCRNVPDRALSLNCVRVQPPPPRRPRTLDAINIAAVGIRSYPQAALRSHDPAIPLGRITRRDDAVMCRVLPTRCLEGGTWASKSTIPLAYLTMRTAT